MARFIRKIQNTVFDNAIFKRGDKLVLGVSGGPDSSAMLDVFSKLKLKCNLELIVVHINYNLRGLDSIKDVEFVKKLAKKYTLPIILLDVKIEKKNNLEEKLRDIRYAFFEKIRKENKFDLIAVAHNLDDQAETMLMHLIRGSGMLGLSAMQLKNKRVVRPFLDITKKEILEYLKEENLKYRRDKTNAQSKFLRNKIRNKLLPYLEKEFNPQIKRVLANTTKFIKEDYAIIEKVAEKEWNKHKNLEIKNILALPVAIQKRFVARMLIEKYPQNKFVNFSQVVEILKAIRSAKNKKQTVISSGLKMTRIGDKINLDFIK